MVAEVRPEYPSQWAAITAVSSKLRIGTPETVRTWIRRTDADAGNRPGVNTAGRGATVDQLLHHAHVYQTTAESVRLTQAG